MLSFRRRLLISFTRVCSILAWLLLAAALILWLLDEVWALGIPGLEPITVIVGGVFSWLAGKLGQLVGSEREPHKFQEWHNHQHMNHKMTSHLLKCLRWLVSQIEDEKIEATFHAGEGSGEPLFIVNFSGEIPEGFTLGDLKTLAANDILVRNGSEYTIKFNRAYEVLTAPTSQIHDKVLLPDTSNESVTAPTADNSATPNQLAKIIHKHFNLAEIREICLELNINYEDLGEHISLSERIYNLVTYAFRHNRQSDLLHVLRQHRPKVAWPNSIISPESMTAENKSVSVHAAGDWMQGIFPRKLRLKHLTVLILGCVSLLLFAALSELLNPSSSGSDSSLDRVKVGLAESTSLFNSDLVVTVNGINRYERSVYVTIGSPGYDNLTINGEHIGYVDVFKFRKNYEVRVVKVNTDFPKSVEFIITDLSTYEIAQPSSPPTLNITATEPASPNTPRDIVLAIDVSASMEADNAIVEAKLVARALLDQVGPEDRVAVVVFSDVAALIQPLSRNSVDIQPYIENLLVSGGSAIDSGLTTASQELLERALPEAQKIIVLMSDGQSDPNTTIAAANGIKSKGISIFSIALGKNADQLLLREIANDEKTHYFVAFEMLDVQKFFSVIND
jgi:hypothetical protein